MKEAYHLTLIYVLPGIFEGISLYTVVQYLAVWLLENFHNFGRIIWENKGSKVGNWSPDLNTMARIWFVL